MREILHNISHEVSVMFSSENKNAKNWFCFTQLLHRFFHQELSWYFSKEVSTVPIIKRKGGGGEALRDEGLGLIKYQQQDQMHKYLVPSVVV